MYLDKVLLLFLIIIASCQQPEEDTLFRQVSSAKSGIDFSNDLIKIQCPTAKLSGIVADFSQVAQIQRLINAIQQPIDLLVNDVGIFAPIPFSQISDEEWMNMIEVNVMSGVRLSRAFLPLMLERNWGRIIFISSESGVQVPDEMIHYGVSKTAQIGLANGIAKLTKGLA